ncbi:reverse transcriptase domain-containing protein [Tanacetum coccineum]
MKHSYSNDDTCFSIDVIDEILEEDFDALLDEGSKILHSIEGTLLEEEIFAEFDEFMAMTADENSDSESDTEDAPFEKITINTNYKIKTSLEEPPTDLELKPLPDNLEYVFLEEPSFLPVIISSQLSKEKKSKLISVLKKHKQAFAWKTTDIPGICPSFCKHKIQLLDDKKPVVQKQRRLNPNMQEVVKKEIVKLLDTGIIYPIADSPWVSPIHCVPKKGGITVVTNENDELVPTRTITGWRVCIDYRKLNEATAKDHFPLPFMDQMLERLAGNKYFCFLDGFSGYFQIPIDPNDQEKTTFTCPFGTYAYRRMPFGLCNAPATFQRCMLAIFHDMIEESVEIFMDDFSVFGNSFDTCLNNLDKMLQRCKDAHLVLNWEKCHFMVKEGIVLGHKVSSAGLEVDKAKIDVISKLPPPTNIKSIRSFLGHAGFYRRFIKDFSKIARPLTKLLEKDTPFEFDDECRRAFESLKEKLTCAPVILIVGIFWKAKQRSQYAKRGVTVFEISSWRGARVGVRTYLLGGAIDGSEANEIIRDPKLELESSCFTFDLVPLNYESVDVVVGENWLLRHKAEMVCHEKVVKMPCVPKELVGFTPRRRIGFRMELVQGATPICEGSCRLTSLERQEVWNDCRSCKVRVGSNGNLLWEASVLLGRKKGGVHGDDVAKTVFRMRNGHVEVYGYAFWVNQCTSGFHGVNEPGGVRVAREDDRGVTEGREDVREVFQQRGSGAKRKLSRCGRNQMGNEPILALPEGADDFVVYYDARSKDLEACLEKGEEALSERDVESDLYGS